MSKQKTPHRPKHSEIHADSHLGWLRAAVLGANDGIVSTASLIIGVVAAQSSQSEVLVAGVAGLVAGTMSMAAGEYVSVYSQADSQLADLEREKEELAEQPEHEHRELAGIYVSRGLEPELAREVARQLMAHDALDAHARDELGIVEGARARPVQAALVSAMAFAVGAAIPLVAAAATSEPHAIVVAAASLVGLAGLGAAAARMGRAGTLRGTLRVLSWGTIAMLVTAGIGSLFSMPI